MIAQLPNDSSFLLLKTQTGLLPTEVPNAGGNVKIDDFQQITRHTSKTSTFTSVVNFVTSAN